MSDLDLRANRTPSSARGQEGRAPAFGGWHARLLLAHWWIGRFALSHLSTGVFTLLAGLFLGLLLDGTVTRGDVPNHLADGFFLLLLANLALSWTSTDYLHVRDDPFSKRVSFLRTLPTSAGDIAGMRLLALLATLPVMASLAFLPPYLIFESVRETFGSYRYLCFVVLWASYGLVSGYVGAYLELGFRARTMLLVQMIWSVLLLALVLVVSAFGGGLLEGSVRLVLSHGSLTAGLALVVAACGAYLWCRLAERRLCERELEA